ncbi:hypothetical protein OLX02_11860 [Novosphingobium sp. KCTC 2891]|uniref:hypothetical protein n=1 Tax=Novosphingobium sp. KCTC 2891 TaxID=2989730 RepID=UPI00222239C5|nr:hypothetical protein [Novosphingobium sp. KCTC 2891]MCW1383515.1 hypothetical protein [Novosphingobium sp. KCTC 2891]
MSADRIVVIIGIAMALMLVLSNGRLKRQPKQKMLMMAAGWAVLIILAGLAFAGFRR